MHDENEVKVNDEAVAAAPVDTSNPAPTEAELATAKKEEEREEERAEEKEEEEKADEDTTPEGDEPAA